MNYYEHHIGDYAQATAHLSMLEDAAYGRLLRWYYAEEKPIPSDLRQACRIARAATEDEREAVRVVLDEFFTLGEDGWHQKRADAEIERYRAKSEKARVSAKTRWGALPSHSDRDATNTVAALPTHSERNANASSEDANASKTDAKAMLTSNQTPVKRKEETPAVAVVTVDDLEADGLPRELASEWLGHRKRIKATLTPRAWDGIKREAATARMSPSQAVQKALERGWRGFEAAWLTDGKQARPASPDPIFKTAQELGL